MGWKQFINPQQDPIVAAMLDAIEWLLVAIPVGLFLLALVASWPGARAGRFLPFSFVFGTLAYLALVGLLGGAFLVPPWLAAVLFFTGMAAAFAHKIEVTSNALLDAAIGGLVLAVLGSLAISGGIIVLATGVGRHLLPWLITCSATSIVAGVRSYLKG